MLIDIISVLFSGFRLNIIIFGINGRQSELRHHQIFYTTNQNLRHHQCRIHETLLVSTQNQYHRQNYTSWLAAPRNDDRGQRQQHQ